MASALQVDVTEAGCTPRWTGGRPPYGRLGTAVLLSSELGAFDAPGKPRAVTMTPQEYRRATNAGFLKDGLIEYEIGSRIEQYGHVATVRSVYAMRRTANGPIDARGVNYFMLYWDGTRWWITGMVWDSERPNNPLPPGWVGSYEVIRQIK